MRYFGDLILIVGTFVWVISMHSEHLHADGIYPWPATEIVMPATGSMPTRTTLNYADIGFPFSLSQLRTNLS